MSVIKVENFTKLYNKFKAVDNISFEINENTIVGFVGKNGAGKSTTIRAILNYIAPSFGSINIFNLDSILKNKEIKERVSYMPSDTSFYDGVTSKDIFKLCLKFSSKSMGEAEELANFLELDINKKISELSLGNKKKVSIIQALLKESSLFILDEPTSGLDPLMQERFFSLLLKKKKQGATIFLSSHNLAEIEKYCDRVLIIKDGNIIDDIDISSYKIKRPQVISYETKTGEKKQFNYIEDINLLIKDLSKLDLISLEIKDSSVEDEFIKYYKEEEC